MNWSLATDRSLSLIHIWHQPRDYPRWDDTRAYDTMASMMHKGKLSAPDLISPIVSLEECPEVFRLIKEDPNQVIKYAVRF